MSAQMTFSFYKPKEICQIKHRRRSTGKTAHKNRNAQQKEEAQCFFPEMVNMDAEIDKIVKPIANDGHDFDNTPNVVRAKTGGAVVSGTIFKRIKYRSLLSAIIGFIAALISALFSSTYASISLKKESVDLSKRIETISENLRNTSNELNQIQRELEQRIEFVEKLNAEAKNAEAMINLSKEQVDAIRATLNTELNKNNTQNFWTSFIMGFFFFILGNATAIITPKLIDILKRLRNKAAQGDTR